jgi:hypothetical protein
MSRVVEIHGAQDAVLYRQVPDAQWATAGAQNMAICRHDLHFDGNFSNPSSQ